MTPLFAVSMYWHLPVMLTVVSIVYSATRFDQFDQIFREAFRWGFRMGFFLFMIAAVLYCVSTFL